MTEVLEAVVAELDSILADEVVSESVKARLGLLTVLVEQALEQPLPAEPYTEAEEV